MIYIKLLNGSEYLFPDFNEIINSGINITKICEYYDMLTDIKTAEFVINKYFD